jgi:hypothetical protein
MGSAALSCLSQQVSRCGLEKIRVHVIVNVKQIEHEVGRIIVEL